MKHEVTLIRKLAYGVIFPLSWTAVLWASTNTWCQNGKIQEANRNLKSLKYFQILHQHNHYKALLIEGTLF